MWWRRRRRDEDFHQEIDAHIALEVDRLIGEGLSQDDARSQARRAFGNVTRTKEQFFESRRSRWLDRFGQDLRYAIRLIRRYPGLALSTIATLAIGVGANVAIFSAMRGVLLRPLPYAHPEEIVMVWQGSKTTPPPVRGYATPLHVLEWRARNECFSEIAVLESSDIIDIDGPGGPERFQGSLVTPNFFRLLGVGAALGRTLSDDDPSNVVVLSDGVWKREFGADPSIVGRSVLLATGGADDRERRPWTVIGVMPPPFRFTYPRQTDLWMPLPWRVIEATNPQFLRYNVLARIKPGMPITSAQANMSAVVDSMARSLPDSYGLSSSTHTAFLNAFASGVIRLESMQDYAVGQTRPAFVLLALVTAFLLVVACVNVASLLLARTAGRTRELALRAALGAEPGRIRGQLFVEGALLAGTGSAAGLLLAGMVQPILRAILPVAFPRTDEVRLDGPAIAWGVALAVVSAIVIGLAPSFRNAKLGAYAALRQGDTTTTRDTRTTKWRRAFVAVQVALVLVIMTAGGLLLRTLWNLQHVDLGFDTANVLTMRLRMLPAPSDQLDTLMARVRAVPGVVSAGRAAGVPTRLVAPVGQLAITTAAGRKRVTPLLVDEEYFRTLHIPLRSGRMFEASDATVSGSVALVSESAAALLFPGRSPIGEQVLMPPSGFVSIVGVVGDAHYRGPAQPAEPMLYGLSTERVMRAFYLVVRTEEGARAVPSAIRSIVKDIDPKQVIESVATFDQIASLAIEDRQFYAVSTVAFAMVGLLLAVAGLYGVVSRGVAEQVREIGIRIALGAERSHLIRLVMGQGLFPVAAGLVVGGVGVAWAARLLQRFLFGVDALDAATLAVVPAVILLVAAAACYIPARRAVRVDPIHALRAE